MSRERYDVSEIRQHHSDRLGVPLGRLAVDRIGETRWGDAAMQRSHAITAGRERERRRRFWSRLALTAAVVVIFTLVLAVAGCSPVSDAAKRAAEDLAVSSVMLREDFALFRRSTVPAPGAPADLVVGLGDAIGRHLDGIAASTSALQSALREGR